VSSLRPSSRTTPIGVDPSGRFLNAAQLVRRGRGWRLVAATSIPRASGGGPATAAEIERLVQAFRRQGFCGQRVVVALAQEGLFEELLELEGAAGDALARAMRREVARTRQCAADSFELACWKLPSQRRGGAVMAIGAQHEHAEACLREYEACGLEVLALDAPACAMARACAAVAAQRTVAVLCLGTSCAQLVLLAQETVLFHRVLSDTGLKRPFDAIAEGLGLDEEGTWQVLLGVGLSATAERQRPVLRGALVPFLDRVAAEASRSLAYLRQEYPEHAVEGVLVIGEGGDIPGVVDHLHGALDVEVRVVRPVDVVGESVSPVARRARLVTALGLAQHPGPW
jgi:type IV pilus assembly protein PilM